MSRLEQLVRYMSNVFHVVRLVKGVSDSRDKSRIRIETSAVLLAWMMGFFARIRSREEMGRLLDRHAVQRLVGRHISSDTLGRVLEQIDSDSLRNSLLVPVVRKIRRNKAWASGTVHGRLLIAIDGSHAFTTRKQPCPQCCSRQVEVKLDGQPTIVTEYYHRAVWAFVIGTDPLIYLDLEPIQPGEGEAVAAMRLVTRLFTNFGRWIDGVVVDAGFAGAPFLNHVRSSGGHYIVRVKDEERRLLLRAATELSAQRPADDTWTKHIGHHNLCATVWDQEGFTQWDGLQEPARVVICDELELAQAAYRRRQNPQPARQRPRAFFATSYSKQAFSAHAVCSAYHRRWDIENNGNRQLKQEWHWDHPFVHTPEALTNLWLLMAVAANLFAVFAVRRLNITRTSTTPLYTVAHQIAAELLTLTVATVPSWNTT